MLDSLKRLAGWTILFNCAYLLWLPWVVEGIHGWLYLIAEFLIGFLLVLFAINHWHRRYQLNGGSYSMRAIVDVFITTKNESLFLLRNTIEAAKRLEYPNTRIYVLDDGARSSVQSLVEELEVAYLTRSDRLKKPYKAANLNYGLAHSYGSYILVLDADQIVKPRLLDDILGHFKDDHVAYVTTKQSFHAPADDFNHDHLFYDYMQTGKNQDNSAISCGSGVIYRRAALEKINGFQEWNIVEDLATSYELNRAGYGSIYVNQAYTMGQAPQDLPTIYKQRGVWSHDSLRLWLWRQPLFDINLSWGQRWHYFEMGYIYFVSAVAIPLLIVTNLISIILNQPVLIAGWIYFVFKLPAFVLSHKMYDTLGKGSSSSRMWASLFPVFLVSLCKAIVYIKPRYSPTPKHQSVSSRTIYYSLPHFFVLSLLFGALIGHFLWYGINILLLVNVFWFVVFCFWFSQVIKKSFDSVNTYWNNKNNLVTITYG